MTLSSQYSVKKKAFLQCYTHSWKYLFMYRNNNVIMEDMYNVLIEILFTNCWRQSFVKQPILKIRLNNSAAVCLWQKLRRDAWKSNFLVLCEILTFEKLIQSISILNDWEMNVIIGFNLRIFFVRLNSQTVIKPCVCLWSNQANLSW